MDTLNFLDKIISELVRLQTFFSSQYDYVAKLSFFSSILLIAVFVTKNIIKKEEFISTFIYKMLLIFFLLSLTGDVNRDGKYGDLQRAIKQTGDWFSNITFGKILENEEKKLDERLTDVMLKTFFVKIENQEIAIDPVQIQLRNGQTLRVIAGILTGNISNMDDRLKSKYNSIYIQGAFILITIAKIVIEASRILMIFIFSSLYFVFLLSCPLILAYSISGNQEFSLFLQYIKQALTWFLLIPSVYAFFLTFTLFIGNAILYGIKHDSFIVRSQNGQIFIEAQNDFIYILLIFSITMLVFSLASVASPMFAFSFIEGKILQAVLSFSGSMFSIGTGLGMQSVGNWQRTKFEMQAISNEMEAHRIAELNRNEFENFRANLQAFADYKSNMQRLTEGMNIEKQRIIQQNLAREDQINQETALRINTNNENLENRNESVKLQSTMQLLGLQKEMMNYIQQCRKEIGEQKSQQLTAILATLTSFPYQNIENPTQIPVITPLASMIKSVLTGEPDPYGSFTIGNISKFEELRELNPQINVLLNLIESNKIDKYFINLNLDDFRIQNLPQNVSQETWISYNAMKNDWNNKIEQLKAIQVQYKNLDQLGSQKYIENAKTELTEMIGKEKADKLIEFVNERNNILSQIEIPNREDIIKSSTSINPSLYGYTGLSLYKWITGYAPIPFNETFYDKYDKIASSVIEAYKNGIIFDLKTNVFDIVQRNKLNQTAYEIRQKQIEGNRNIQINLNEQLAKVNSRYAKQMTNLNKEILNKIQFPVQLEIINRQNELEKQNAFIQYEANRKAIELRSLSHVYQTFYNVLGREMSKFTDVFERL
ncbi:MAG: hypothetical protein N2505_00180 [Endomicrobia bacterium]|nr:hypothetical protein [Endomicrobiia bacterium]